MENPVIAPAAAPATPAAPAVAPSISAADIASLIAANNVTLLAQLKPAPIATPAAPATQTQAERIAFLEKYHADAAADKVKSIRNSAIESAVATAKDFTKPQLTALQAVFERQYGDNITVEGDKAFYTSPETGKIDVSAQFATFLKGDVATSLRPAPNLPGGAALDSSGKPTTPAPTAHEWAGKTFKEMQTLKLKEPAKYLDLMTNPAHQATFVGIMATA